MPSDDSDDNSGNHCCTPAPSLSRTTPSQLYYRPSQDILLPLAKAPDPPPFACFNAAASLPLPYHFSLNLLTSAPLYLHHQPR